MPDSERLRKIEVQVSEIATDMKYVVKYTDQFSTFMSEIKSGERTMPQCKANQKEINDIKEKIASGKGFINSLKLTGLGATITLFVHYLWDKITS